MAKGKRTVFFCQNCGYEASKWAGQCPACHEWNTFAEEVVASSAKQSTKTKKAVLALKPQPISQITYVGENRKSTHMDELDRVLGGD